MLYFYSSTNWQIPGCCRSRFPAEPHAPTCCTRKASKQEADLEWPHMAFSTGSIPSLRGKHSSFLDGKHPGFPPNMQQNWESEQGVPAAAAHWYLKYTMSAKSCLLNSLGPRLIIQRTKSFFFFSPLYSQTNKSRAFCLGAVLRKELCLAKWTSCPKADRCREQVSSGFSQRGWRTWYPGEGATSPER